MSDDGYVRSAQRIIPAPPEAIFAVLTDPERHREIDGSGTVRGVRASDRPLTSGSSFDMHMRRGFAYSTRSTVTEFEPGRVIAWQTRPLTLPLPWFIGGRTWRYELEPVDGGTRVTETWDLRAERNRALVRPLAGDPERDMAQTLERLERLVT
ncbi:SRPBCC family protein [uncultured Jatrophihabitans sp.]|uniref:SRPBCC family protein n=1 Tax=uncultured Jatrophihabitans sp. TaxID=1610747 RepID=UPI0035CC9B5E